MKNPLSLSTLLSALLVFASLHAHAMESFETITFPSEDNLEVTADFYPLDDPSNGAIIVLFHQAGFSRGEYREIAPRLQSMGFQALAVDQRSGGAANGVTNLTSQRAKAARLGTTFTDALPDLRAALAHARSLTTGPVLGWGSSYSSSLILKVAADEQGLVDGVLSFSPSEYFPDRQLIQNAVVQLSIPTFITSARSEANNYSSIVSKIPSDTAVTTFRPPTAGRHGSSALWSSTADSETTWPEVTAFLSPFLVSQAPAPSQALAFTDAGLAVQPSATPHLLQRSVDLRTWQGLSVISEGAALTLSELSVVARSAFFRLSQQTEPITADVVSVSASGSSVSVGIRSPETGCDQYADWWEILDEDGKLLYRRILAHSHVTEQPFTRSGSVTLAPEQTVWIRAHMNTTGYGGQAFRGSVSGGFAIANLSPTFALNVAVEMPLPDGCAF